MSKFEIKIGPEGVTSNWKLLWYSLRWILYVLLALNSVILIVSTSLIYIKTGILPSIDQIMVFISLRLNLFVSMAIALLYFSQYRSLIHAKLIFADNSFYFTDSPKGKDLQKISSIDLNTPKGFMILTLELKEKAPLKIRLSNPKSKIPEINKLIERLKK